MIGLGSASAQRRTTISAKLFVGNLSYSTTKDELVAALSECGKIIDAFLPTDRETGRPRGFAFITFETPEEAKACIARFDGQDVGGRRINVNEAEDRPRRPPGAGAPSGRPSRPGGGDRPNGERTGGGRDDGRPSFPPRDGGGPRPSGPRPGVGGPRGNFGPRSDAPAPVLEEGESWDQVRGADWRDEGEDDSAGDRQWGKKKKRGKGSRRGLRAKKRSL